MHGGTLLASLETCPYQNNDSKTHALWLLEATQQVSCDGTMNNVVWNLHGCPHIYNTFPSTSFSDYHSVVCVGNQLLPGATPLKGRLFMGARGWLLIICCKNAHISPVFHGIKPPLVHMGRAMTIRKLVFRPCPPNRFEVHWARSSSSCLFSKRCLINILRCFPPRAYLNVSARSSFGLALARHGAYCSLLVQRDCRRFSNDFF